MAYIVSSAFKMAIDGIGLVTREFQVGELNATDLSERSIDWMLRNGKIDEVGNPVHNADESKDNQVSDHTIISAEDPIATTNSLGRKQAIIEYAAKFGVTLEKDKLENMRAQFADAYKNKMRHSTQRK